MIDMDEIQKEITYETVLTLQRIAQWFEDISTGVTELTYGNGWRNTTIKDVNRRLPDFIKDLNKARKNVIDCWERDE